MPTILPPECWSNLPIQLDSQDTLFNSPPFILGRLIYNAFLVPNDRGHRIRTPKLHVYYGAENAYELSGSSVVYWTILLEYCSSVFREPSAVVGTRTRQLASHDLGSILWPLLYCAKHHSLCQVSGGWSGDFSRED